MSPLPGNRVNSEVNVLIREQLSYQSWLLIGAAIQSALVYTVRAPYSLIPLLASLAYIVIPYTLESLRVIPRRSSPPVDKGRLVAQPPTPNTGVTVFVLGFQSAHPLRIMAPGTKEMGEHFAKIFATAEADPNSGLLGRTGTMFDDKGEGGNAMMSISYWTCEEKLKAWHSGPAHSEAMKWYYSTRTKYPHIGIMHELYNSPAGEFENVYINFRPFGFKETKWMVDGEKVPAAIQKGGGPAKSKGKHDD